MSGRAETKMGVISVASIPDETLRILSFAIWFQNEVKALGLELSKSVVSFLPGLRDVDE